MDLKPPYKPVDQLPHCCVPACLSMVFDRRGIPHGSQEEIGIELGLYVSKKNAHLFKKASVQEDPDGEYGTRVYKPEFSINSFFSKNDIRLKEAYFPVKKVKNIKRFIVDNLKTGNDIVVCINNRILYGKGHGHTSLIQSIDGDEVTLVEPKPDKPKHRVVDLDKLIEAMQQKYHKRKRGGFWAISDL